MIFLFIFFISSIIFSLQLEINLKNGDFPFEIIKEVGFSINTYKISRDIWLLQIWQDPKYLPSGNIFLSVLKEVKDIKSQIEYDPYISSEDFEKIISLKKGNCISFVSFLDKRLRERGFITKQITGLLFSKEKNNPFYLSRLKATPHRWIRVFFPEMGWFSFDPLSETGRITSFHLPLKSPELLPLMKEIEIKVLQWDS